MKGVKGPLGALQAVLGPPAAGTDFEHELIQATLDFANMELRGASRYEVEALFTPFARDLCVPKGKGKRLFGAFPRRPREARIGGYFEDRNCRTIETYQGQQKPVREALDSIIAGKGLAKGLDRLNGLLGVVPLRLGLVDGAVVYRFKIESVMQGWALGLVVLHNSGRSTQHCENCNQVFVRWRPKNFQQRHCPECVKEKRRYSNINRQSKFRNVAKLVDMIGNGEKPKEACAKLGLDTDVLTQEKVVEAIKNAPPPSRRRKESPVKMWNRRLIEWE